MIAYPINDAECLTKLTEVAAAAVARPDVRQLAARFRTPEELVAWIQALPQRNDEGDPGDGPRVDCDVSQRVRVVADDPNCVERSLLYISVAELLDPDAVRQLATIAVAQGRHTFPVEDGRPVVLDPAVPRNALAAGLGQVRNAVAAAPDPAPDELDPADDPFGFVLEVGEDVAEVEHGRAGISRMRRAEKAFQQVAAGRLPALDEIEDALYATQAAARAAASYGAAGVRAVRSVHDILARAAHAVSRRRDLPGLKRIAYWGGKASADWLGWGALYDPVHDRLVGRRRRPRTDESRATPRPDPLAEPDRPAEPEPSAPAPATVAAFGTFDSLVKR